MIRSPKFFTDETQGQAFVLAGALFPEFFHGTYYKLFIDCAGKIVAGRNIFSCFERKETGTFHFSQPLYLQKERKGQNAGLTSSPVSNTIIYSYFSANCIKSEMI